MTRSAPSIAGLYALAALDGAPVDRTDRATLGLDDIATTTGDDGCRLRLCDPRAAAIHVRRAGDRIDAFLGDLDEPGDVAGLCGLTPTHGALALACAMQDRLGVDAAPRMFGEWLLARWDGAARTLTLMMGGRARDACYVATDGRRVAVAPDLARLARLDWVGDDFDPEAMLLSLGVARVRALIGDATLLRGVRRVLPGTMVTIRLDDRRVARAAPLPEPALLDIPFDEAIARIDAVLDRIVAQRLARHPSAAIMLSGGLDSSLVAAVAARVAGEGTRLLALTSAAPPGSGIADETEWAGATARRLGMPIARVTSTASVYRPSPRTFEVDCRPIPPFQHYIADAFHRSALDYGADLLIDGGGGEMTVSSYGEMLGRDFGVPIARRLARAAREQARAILRRQRPDPGAMFHLALAPGRLGDMPSAIVELARQAERSRRRRADAPFGIDPGVAKMATAPTATADPRLRLAQPLLDQRLITLFAALPTRVARQDGVWRAPARALLRGRVPDEVVARQAGRPFVPGLSGMLRDHAADTLARVSLYRAVGAGAWLDLDWLETALATARTSPPAGLRDQYRLQLTATAAEFFCWWHDRRQHDRRR